MLSNAFLLILSLIDVKFSNVLPRRQEEFANSAPVAQRQKSVSYVVLPINQMVEKSFEGYKEGVLAPDDFIIIETKLKEFVAEYNQGEAKSLEAIYAQHPELKHRKRGPLMSLRNYKRQYICAINENGDKIVWVNCFCSEGKDYWRKRVVFVSDGGRCYFNLKINLTKKLTYDVMVNGVA